MNKIYIIGDIHGNFKPIRKFYTYMNSSVDRLDETDTIIQLGDFGGNFFFDYRDQNFKEKLGKYKVNYFVIRGNHEERPSICAEKDPDNWTQEEFFNSLVWVEKKYPYIKYAMDYPEEYNILGQKTLIIPGAYSVDKWYRLQNGWGWFPQEQLTKEEMQQGKMICRFNNNNFNLVLSHTCPVFYEPTDLFISQIDQSMVDKTMERYLGEIEKDLNYDLWCWGHYHKTRIYPQFNKSDRIMLFNNAVLNLNKYIEYKNPYDSLIQF